MPFTLASGSNPLHHVLDNQSQFSNVFGADIRLSTVSVVVAGIGIIVTLLWVATRIRTGPESMGNERYVTRGKFAHLIEALIVYLYEGMLVPVMGDRLARRWLPFLLSLFFLILTLNILGLIPFMDVPAVMNYLTASSAGDTGEQKDLLVFFGGTATASLSVTGALALCSFIAIQYQGFRELGIGGWLEHLCGGAELVRGPKALWLVVPIIFVVELLGLFIKPAALAIRLFANMVGGHTLMATLMGFGAMAASKGILAVLGISVVSGVFAVVISFMELFVAVLQAFIFMFLTAVFISQMAHHDDHEEHADDHGHGHEAHPQPAGAHH
ncbi:MAG: F0F1 ATP synthase subunit A [Phycisphaerales bacterium]